jgi:methyltransferase (TIGR00027 family)
VGAPKGIYAYIIARTRYFDAVYQQAPANRFDQIAILGAGFDTRAVRFPVGEGPTMVYELDSRCTQNTKLSMYTRNAIPLPPYMKFGAIDFETESLQEKLEGIGFLKKRRCLFILEGVSMYLKPESVHDMFLSMIDFMGRQSLIAFDYIYADVLRHEKKHYGETEIMNSVSRVKEAWQFGIERNALPQFLSRYNLQLVNHMSARDIEQTHFRNDQGKIIRRVNATHCCAIVEN